MSYEYVPDKVFENQGGAGADYGELQLTRIGNAVGFVVKPGKISLERYPALATLTDEDLVEVILKPYAVKELVAFLTKAVGIVGGSRADAAMIAALPNKLQF